LMTGYQGSLPAYTRCWYGILCCSLHCEACLYASKPQYGIPPAFCSSLRRIPPVRYLLLILQVSCFSYFHLIARPCSKLGSCSSSLIYIFYYNFNKKSDNFLSDFIHCLLLSQHGQKHSGCNCRAYNSGYVGSHCMHEKVIAWICLLPHLL